MQILWPSRLCDCSFVMEFDPGMDTRTRPYKAVAWGPDEEVVEVPIDQYPIVTSARARDACPKHDQDDHEAAFRTVLAEHIEAGFGEDYRKIVVNGWTAPCGCVTTSQFHRDGATGADPTADTTRIVGPVLRRCADHQHLEGIDVFRQVRTESVAVSIVWSTIERLIPKEPRWVRADGSFIWEADLTEAQRATVRLLLGEPEMTYRDPPSVEVDQTTRGIQVTASSEIAAALREALPDIDVQQIEG